MSLPNSYTADAYCLIPRVRSLSIILQDVHIISQQRDLTDKQEKELRCIAAGCHNVLSTLDKTLEKYQELGSEPNDGDLRGFPFKVRRRLKRLKWEPEDIKELRSRVITNISLLNAFNEGLIMYSPFLY